MVNYIRFDWAIKRMLRDKANHAVIEGLLTSLLGEKVTIKQFLESEGNQASEDDKFNRVDILAENEKEELLIIEIQNTRELAYFQRMLYGASKVITDYINLGDQYDKVRKVYSINIVYFELGQGKDYVYHGKTVFQGLHEPHDTLKLSITQNKRFFGIIEPEERKRKSAGDIFPEYYVLRVNDFDNVSKTPLDEWISFLKTGHIDDNATAPGLERARECMRFDELSDADRLAYLQHMEAVRTQKSLLETSRYEGKEEGREEGLIEGLIAGREEGIKAGREEGIKAGREEGIKAGREEGIKAGREEGIKAGREEGIKAGREEGIKAGREEGRAEGIKAGKAEQFNEDMRNVALKMKEQGIPFETIAAVTGMTEEDIQNI